MIKLQTKSQFSECETLQRIYRDIKDKIGQKKDRLMEVNNDWQAATSQKLSTTSDVERALLTGAQNNLVRQKQRLKKEIWDLEKERDDIRNDYNLRRCTAQTGSIG